MKLYTGEKKMQILILKQNSYSWTTFLLFPNSVSSFEESAWKMDSGIMSSTKDVKLKTQIIVLVIKDDSHQPLP